ncbi:hypothetical protein HYX09_05350 [Candidatus Woesearchaeota archaeon]|nr:hypothetical protein [Candidatus Woesearchaeota archaeon]
MSCSYSSGVMKALVEKYKFTEPDIVVAASGSAGVLTYYVSKQYGPMVNIWCDYLADKRFINFLRFWRIIDIDYLVDTVLGEKEKLDEQTVKKSKIRLFVPAMNVKNAEITYFSNNSDLLKVLKATKAVPVAYNMAVKIGDGFFCDSGVTSSSSYNIKKALDLGAKKLIIIDNHNHGDSRVFKIWLHTRNEIFKRKYKQQMNETEEFEIQEDVEYVILKAGCKNGFLKNDLSFLKNTIKKGYDEAIKSKKLREIVSSSL